MAYHERGDRNVTAGDFARTFGMYAPISFADRKIDAEGEDSPDAEFVKLAQEEAQAKANGAYDGLMAIAKTMGVPPEVLSLGGLIAPTLGFIADEQIYGRFDSQTGEIIMPIEISDKDRKNFSRRTKEFKWWRKMNERYGHAKGTMIHEWFHALDNALAHGRDADWLNDDGSDEPPDVKNRKGVRFRYENTMVGEGITSRALSYPDGWKNGLFTVVKPPVDSVRPEVREAFVRLQGAVRNTSYGKRQLNAKAWLKKYEDELSGSLESTADYKSRTEEMLARAFEQVVLEASGSGGGKREFCMKAFMKPAMPDALAYPTSEEVRELLPIFREFFSALEVGVNEKTGLPTLFSTAKGDPVAAMDGARQWLETKFIHDQTPVFEAVRRVMGVGGEPPDALNVEAAAKNVHGKIRARQEEVNTVYVNTIVDLLKAPGMSKEVFDDYAMALHAIDRNRMIRARSVVVDPETGEVLDPGLEAGFGMSDREIAQAIARVDRDPNAARYRQAAELLAQMNRFVLDGAGKITRHKGSLRGRTARMFEITGWHGDLHRGSQGGNSINDVGHRPTPPIG